MPAQLIDKGLATAGLLAQVLVPNYADYQPLHRQESIFERAGLALSLWVSSLRSDPVSFRRTPGITMLRGVRKERNEQRNGYSASGLYGGSRRRR